jgi:hypothetical protein
MTHPNDIVVIDYKGELHTFNRPRNVSFHIFHDKCWFIVKNSSEANIEAFADMYVSWKYNGCEYSIEHMEKIKKMEQNLKMKPISPKSPNNPIN